MPRTARLVISDMARHVTQRGNRAFSKATGEKLNVLCPGFPLYPYYGFGDNDAWYKKMHGTFDSGGIIFSGGPAWLESERFKKDYNTEIKRIIVNQMLEEYKQRRQRTQLSP